MATNSTTYYNLPVFAAGDKPKWLVDWNTTMNLIDSAIAAAKAAGDNAQITANANAVAITGLNESVSTMSTALGALTTNVTTLTGNVQRINELIGNGTPTTQDKTIIGAINELKAAIDALAPGGEVDAEDVSYDNTNSGLTATNVQAAIDEIAQGGAVDFNLSTNVTATLTAASGVTIDNTYAEVKVLTNANSSVGKIYGYAYCTASGVSGADWFDLFTISASNLPAISEAYNIDLGFIYCLRTSSIPGSIASRLHFNTNGTVSLQVKTSLTDIVNFSVSLPPCLYFLKNLGD